MSRLLIPWICVSVLGRGLAMATVERPEDGPFRRAFGRWLRSVAFLLEYEPSWFAEFGLALSAVLWGAGALLTDDYDVTGAAFVLPCCAILGGLLRMIVLLRLWYEARVLMAALSAALWAFLWISIWARFGILPLPGLLVGAFVIDLLTAAKFAIPCAQELREEYLAQARAR